MLVVEEGCDDEVTAAAADVLAALLLVVIIFERGDLFLGGKCSALVRARLAEGDDGIEISSETFIEDLAE